MDMEKKALDAEEVELLTQAAKIKNGKGDEASKKYCNLLKRYNLLRSQRRRTRGSKDWSRRGKFLSLRLAGAFFDEKINLDLTFIKKYIKVILDVPNKQRGERSEIQNVNEQKRIRTP